ncbi:MAG: hypothetical protein HKN05_14760, partial [Rhizobiales bacterium]|nr:hypothetical protein [Hyphomicrobiales bacterium]
MNAAGLSESPPEHVSSEPGRPRGRVAHLTSVHPPHDPRISKHCRSLLNAGWDVCLVAQEGRTATPGVRHLTIPMETSRLRRTFLSSWRVFRQALASGAKICHFHDPELLPVGMVLSLLGRKVVYDVHEDVPLQILSKKWISPWLRRPMAMLTASAEGLATRLFFAGVVAATPPIARRFPANTTVTVQNFPEIVASAPAPTAQSLRQRPDRAIYIGSINENRGLREIIRAVDLSANTSTSLILCGQFTDPVLEAECRALPAWSRVDFRGWQTSDQVLDALAEAKVGLVTLG